MQSPPTSGVITECTMFRWIRTSEMCFSMKLYTVDRDSVAYDEETARLDDLLESSSAPRGALDDKRSRHGLQRKLRSQSCINLPF